MCSDGRALSVQCSHYQGFRSECTRLELSLEKIGTVKREDFIACSANLFLCFGPHALTLLLPVNFHSQAHDGPLHLVSLMDMGTAFKSTFIDLNHIRGQVPFEQALLIYRHDHC